MKKKFKVFSLINPRLTVKWLAANGTGKDVQVAVIDSGIDAKHPALRGKVMRACVVHTSSGKVICREIPGRKSYDTFGHGTGVAGIISDLAPGARFISVKVLGEDNTGSGDALIAGLRWALNNKIKLINMSLATINEKFVPALFDLCEQAYVQDAILVVSKRNCGPLGYPAMFSSVISVDCEAFQEKLMITRYLEKRIQYGARGENVEVAYLNGVYRRSTGTSFATPHVTGIAALLLSIFPGIRSSAIKAVLDKFSQDFNNRNLKK